MEAGGRAPTVGALGELSLLTGQGGWSIGEGQVKVIYSFRFPGLVSPIDKNPLRSSLIR